jgi:hypothetical protein
MSLTADCLQTWHNLCVNTTREARDGLDEFMNINDPSITDQHKKMVGLAVKGTQELAAYSALGVCAWGEDPTEAVWSACEGLPLESELVPHLYPELPECGLWLFKRGKSPRFSHGLLWHLDKEGLMCQRLDARSALPGLTFDSYERRYYGEHDLSPAFGRTFGFHAPITWPTRVTLSELPTHQRRLHQRWAGVIGERYQVYNDSPNYLCNYIERFPQFLGETDGHQGLNSAIMLPMFWLAGVQWMKQRVLVRERHTYTPPKNKKRARRLAKAGTAPRIEVVHLRRAQTSPTQSTGTNRPYAVRFVVRGFWRKQWYPSKKAHAPLWIESFIKGPAHAPIKTTTRIYSATR